MPIRHILARRQSIQRTSITPSIKRANRLRQRARLTDLRLLGAAAERNKLSKPDDSRQLDERSRREQGTHREADGSRLLDSKPRDGGSPHRNGEVVKSVETTTKKALVMGRRKFPGKDLRIHPRSSNDASSQKHDALLATNGASQDTSGTPSPTLVGEHGGNKLLDSYHRRARCLVVSLSNAGQLMREIKEAEAVKAPQEQRGGMRSAGSKPSNPSDVRQVAKAIPRSESIAGQGSQESWADGLEERKRCPQSSNPSIWVTGDEHRAQVTPGSKLRPMIPSQDYQSPAAEDFPLIPKPALIRKSTARTPSSQVFQSPVAEESQLAPESTPTNKVADPPPIKRPFSLAFNIDSMNPRVRRRIEEFREPAPTYQRLKQDATSMTGGMNRRNSVLADTTNAADLGSYCVNSLGSKHQTQKHSSFKEVQQPPSSSKASNPVAKKSLPTSGALFRKLKADKRSPEAEKIVDKSVRFHRARLRRILGDELVSSGRNRQELKEEISIGDVLESHHTYDLGSPPLAQMTQSLELQRKSSLGEDSHPATKMYVRGPKLSPITRRRVVPSRRELLREAWRRNSGKTEQLNPSLKKSHSDRVTMILKTGRQKQSEGASGTKILNLQSIEDSGKLEKGQESTGLSGLPLRDQSEAAYLGQDSAIQASSEDVISSSHKTPSTPPEESTLESTTRDDFGHANLKDIPFENSWFDDIRQEQPPEFDQPKPAANKRGVPGNSKDQTSRAPKPRGGISQTYGSLDVPSNEVRLDGSAQFPEASLENAPQTPNIDPLPSARQIIHDTLTARPVRGETAHEAVLKAVQKLSLREELFPEESRLVRPNITPVKKLVQSSYKPHMPFESQSSLRDDESRVKDELAVLQGSRRWENIGVLLLETASTALSDDDFQRLTIKGKHIEEWRSAGGSVQVIPARDPNTLLPRGFYYLVFPNEDLARTYRDQIQDLHKLTRTHTPTSIESSMAPPPGMLINGQNVHRLMQDFTLCPPGQHLDITLIRKPYAVATQKVIEHRGYQNIDIPGRAPRSGRSVVFWLKWYPPTTSAVNEFLAQDGRIRGLPWGPMDGKGSMEKLEDEGAPDGRAPWRAQHEMAHDGSEEQDEENERGSADSEEDDYEQGAASSRRELANYPRWIISFEDENEARRFVRTWHQRPWPGQFGANDVSLIYGDSTPLIQVEFLW